MQLFPECGLRGVLKIERLLLLLLSVLVAHKQMEN
jgi:hypothetical protein